MIFTRVHSRLRGHKAVPIGCNLLLAGMLIAATDSPIHASDNGSLPPALTPVTPAETGLDPHAGLIYGATSCASSGCHGGAAEQHYQHAIWSRRDPHSRAYATLTTARSARMAEALGIANPATDTSCTTCHAPTQAAASVQPALLGPDARAAEGVSCVSCHGPSGEWLRGHTRADMTHAQKVAGGLRDLHDLHARANACVACHQNIAPELISVGRHPRLIFELDGQTAAQPRHWTESPDNTPAQAWLVGQAVALREISHALRTGNADPSADAPRWSALHWLLRQTDATTNASPRFADIPTHPDAASYASAVIISDQIARDTARRFDTTRAAGLLARLAATHNDFADVNVTALEHALRAERLVLALDRLIHTDPAARQNPAAEASLDALFGLAQSIPDFNPDAFARQLDRFARTLP